MKRQFEEQEKKEEERREKRRQRDEERARLKKQEDEEKAARLARLEEVKNQRLEHEKRKKEEEKRVEEEKKLAAIKAEQEAIMKEEEEYAAQELRNMTDHARAVQEEKELQLKLEEHVRGKFDHLHGEERLRAEAAEKMAENRRLKALERKRLLEETRRYAESRLALKDARDMSNKLATTALPVGFSEEVVSGTRAVSAGAHAEVGKKRKIGVQSKAKKKTALSNTKMDVPSEMTVTELAKESLKSRTIGTRASSAHSSSKPASQTTLEAKEINDAEAGGLEGDHAKVRRKAELEAKREALAMEEIVRLEKSREKLRKIEEERIKQIEAADKLKQEKSLQRIMRKKKEEDRRVAAEEEKMLRAEERKKRLEESAAVRKLEAELAQAEKQGSKTERAKRKKRSSPTPRQKQTAKRELCVLQREKKQWRGQKNQRG